MIIEVVFSVSFVFGQLLSLIFPSIRWSFLDVFAACMSLLWMIRLVQKKSSVRQGRLLPWMSLFILVSAIVLPHTIDNWLYLVRWTAYAGMYAYVVSENRRISWRMVLYSAGVAMAVIGLVQYVVYPDLRNLTYLGWDPHYRRVFATLFDPNFAGIIYTLTFFSGMWLWRYRMHRIWTIFGLPVAGVALLFTYSRSTFLAFIAGIGIWFLARRSYGKFIGLLLVFITCILLLPMGMEGQNLLRSTSSFARIGSMAIGWNRLMQSPLLGNGFVPGGIDTSLLFAFASVGLFGGIAYVMLLIRMFVSKDTLLGSTLVAVFVHSVFLNSLFYPWVMVWVWILIAETEKEITAGR